MDQNTGELWERFVDGDCLFEGKVLELHVDRVSLPDDRVARREVVRHKGAVCVLPLDADGYVYMERQFRYAVGRVMWEIPAGKLDSAEELPFDAVRRELAEEIGATAGKWTELGLYLGSPAILDEKIHMYLAEELRFGDCHRDEGEFLDVVRVPLREMAERVLRGEISDGKTQAAILRVYLMKERGMLS